MPEVQTSNHNDNRWLVKSSERILGPFTAEEIEKKLLSREIVLIDEVSDAFGRWHYIRDEKYFAKSIEKLRVASHGSKEDTELGNSKTHTVEKTVSATNELTVDLQDEHAETVSGILNQNSTSEIQEVDFVDIDDRKNASAVKNQNSNFKSYGVTQSSQVEKQIKKGAKLFWVLSLFVVVAAIYAIYVVETKPEAQITGQAPDFGKSFDLGVKLYRQGDFVNALKAYKEAYALKPNDVDLNLAMAPLLIYLEGQYVEVKRRMNEVLAMVHETESIKQANTILALIAINDDDLQTSKKLLEDTLKIDPKYIPAIYNYSVILIKLGNYSQAREYLQLILAQDPRLAQAYLLSARAEIEQQIKAQQINPSVKLNFKSSHLLLSKLQQNLFDFKHEAAILQSYLYFLEQQAKESFDNVIEALDSDPYLTDEHWHDPLMSSSFLGWSGLLDYCQKMYSKNTQSKELKALMSVCFIKSGRQQDAPQLIEEAVAQVPNDTRILSVQAFIKMSIGQFDEAFGVLNLAQKNTYSHLSSVLQARYCERNHDRICVSQQDDKLFKLKRLSPYVKLLMAQSAFLAHDDAKLQQNLDILKSNAPNYMPFLKLESELADEAH